MKTLLTTICCLIAAINFGQNFSVSGTDSTFFGNIADSDFSAKFILYNDSTTTFPMTWEVESENVQAGWQYSVCDPSNCYPIGVSTANFTMPMSSFNRIMNLHYYPNGIAGQSTVSVRLYQQNQPSSYIILSWTGVISTVGSAEFEESYNMLLYPNPSNNGTFNVNYDFNKKEGLNEFVVYDMLGKEIKRIILLSSQGEFQFTLPNSGLYIYKLISDGEIIKSSQLISE